MSMEKKIPSHGLSSPCSGIMEARAYRGSIDTWKDDGIGSVLEVGVRGSGAACLRLHFYGADGKPSFWAVELSQKQRLDLADLLSSHVADDVVEVDGSNW